MVTTTKQPLQQVALRFAGVAQALVALPCMLYLFGRTYMYLHHCFDKWYFFTTFLLAATACLGIVFVACVQWKAFTSNMQTLKLEAFKTALAEILFLWVNLSHSYNPKRYILTGLTVVVLFWAPLYYAYVAVRDEKENEVLKENERLDFGNNRGQAYSDAPYTDAFEKTPLLGNQV